VKLYYQWSLRGSGLEELVASRVLEDLKEFDPDSYLRYRAMVDRYFKKLDRIQ
jgi:transcriptional regulator NrdR family protein